MGFLQEFSFEDFQIHFSHPVKPFFSSGLLMLSAVCLCYGFQLNQYLDFGNRTEFGIAIFEMCATACIIHGIHLKKNSMIIFAGFCSSIAFLYKPVGMASLLAYQAYLVFIDKDLFDVSS